jgi:hypothetical protein
MLGPTGTAPIQATDRSYYPAPLSVHILRSFRSDRVITSFSYVTSGTKKDGRMDGWMDGWIDGWLVGVEMVGCMMDYYGLFSMDA